MIWHIARAFTEQELRARSDKHASVELRYDMYAGYYQFRVTAASKEGLADALRFVGMQVDRALEELQRGA